MRIIEMHVTPIAIGDPPLLNAAGLHAPYALRTIIEIVTDDGITGLAVFKIVAQSEARSIVRLFRTHNGQTIATQRWATSGTETFDVIGERRPRADLTLVIHRKNGERVEVPVTCRLDTAEEVSIYEAGGVLQRFAKDFLESTK